MQLPNSALAWIPTDKVIKYLLSDDHPDGRHKARFFGALGFTSSDPSGLERELLRIANSEPLAEVVDSAFGRLYLVDGLLNGARGSARIRTVWIVTTGDIRPQLVTAFPNRHGGPGDRHDS